MSDSWYQHLLVDTVGSPDELASVHWHAQRCSRLLISVKLTQNMRPFADRSTTFMHCSGLNLGPSCVWRAHKGLRHHGQLHNRLNAIPYIYMSECSETDWKVFPLMSGGGGITGEMTSLRLRMHTAICRLSDWLRKRWIVRTQR